MFQPSFPGMLVPDVKNEDFSVPTLVWGMASCLCRVRRRLRMKLSLLQLQAFGQLAKESRWCFVPRG